MGVKNILATVLQASILAFAGSATPAFAQEGQEGQEGEPPSLSERAKSFLEESGVPAVGVALVLLDEPTEIAVAGLRLLGRDEQVEPDDLWHVGSITKSFTATLIARLIERGTPLEAATPEEVLDWDTPLKKLLPEASDTPFAEVPVRLWLGHRTGMVANPSMAWFGKRVSETPIRELRHAVVTELLASKPTSAADTQMLYSNAGYIVIGHALEHLLDESWEDLLRREVLVPLQLESAGFGPPGTVNDASQPRGHAGQNNEDLRPIAPTPIADNPPLLGPAGTLHLDLGDLSAYTRAHLAGEVGVDSDFLSPKHFRTLHTPLNGQDYALGWIRFPDGEGPAATLPGDLLMHNGSNTIWYAVIFLAPEMKAAAIVTVNAGIHNARPVNQLALQILADLERTRVQKSGAQ